MRIQKEQLRFYSIITLGLNLSSIILGILYFIIGSNLILGTIYDIILVISWFSSLGLVFIDDSKLIKTNRSGKMLNYYGYFFLLFQIISLLLLVGGIFLINADWTSPLIQYSLICVGFFGTFILGSFLAYFNIRKLVIREAWKFE